MVCLLQPLNTTVRDTRQLIIYKLYKWITVLNRNRTWNHKNGKINVIYERGHGKHSVYKILRKFSDNNVQIGKYGTLANET